MRAAIQFRSASSWVLQVVMARRAQLQMDMDKAHLGHNRKADHHEPH